MANDFGRRRSTIAPVMDRSARSQKHWYTSKLMVGAGLSIGLIIVLSMLASSPRSTKIAVDAPFVSFNETIARLSKLPGCAVKQKMSPSADGSAGGRLFGCSPGGEELVHFYVNEGEPDRVRNLKIMWNDRTDSIGSIKHGDRDLLPTAITTLSAMWPDISSGMNPAMMLFAFDQDRAGRVETDHRVLVTYKMTPGLRIDERLLTLVPMPDGDPGKVRMNYLSIAPVVEQPAPKSEKIRGIASFGYSTVANNCIELSNLGWSSMLNRQKGIDVQQNLNAMNQKYPRVDPDLIFEIVSRTYSSPEMSDKTYQMNMAKSLSDNLQVDCLRANR